MRFSPALDPSGDGALCTEAVDIAVPINGKQGRRRVRLLSERLGKRAGSPLRERSILTLDCQSSVL